MYIPCDLRNFDIVETKDGNLLVYVKEAGTMPLTSVLVHLTGQSVGFYTTYDRLTDERPVVGMFMTSRPFPAPLRPTNNVARVWRAVYVGDVIRLIREGNFDNFKANAMIVYQNPSAPAYPAKPAPRKMTVGEISKKLGHEVEVVKG
jgi:hypothetical protein